MPKLPNDGIAPKVIGLGGGGVVGVAGLGATAAGCTTAVGCGAVAGRGAGCAAGVVVLGLCSNPLVDFFREIATGLY